MFVCLWLFGDDFWWNLWNDDVRDDGCWCFDEDLWFVMLRMIKMKKKGNFWFIEKIGQSNTTIWAVKDWILEGV